MYKFFSTAVRNILALL